MCCHESRKWGVQPGGMKAEWVLVWLDVIRYVFPKESEEQVSVGDWVSRGWTQEFTSL